MQSPGGWRAMACPRAITAIYRTILAIATAAITALMEATLWMEGRVIWLEPPD